MFSFCLYLKYFPATLENSEFGRSLIFFCMYVVACIMHYYVCIMLPYELLPTKDVFSALAKLSCHKECYL